MWRGGLPTLSSVGASLAPPCSVSTPRSSNRTCGFDASGSRRRLTQSPRPLPVTPSATSENNSGVIRLIANLPFYRRFLRPPSTEAPSLPRLRQYYEPLRHPSQPGPSLTSCQLIHTAITAGTSRVALSPLFFCLHAVANTPAGLMEFVRSYDSVSFGLPSIVGGSAPASPFSGPAQRLLVLRPACSPGRLCDPLHQRLQQSRCLHCCSDCYRVERTSSRAGLPPLWTGAFHGARRTWVKVSSLSGRLRLALPHVQISKRVRR